MGLLDPYLEDGTRSLKINGINSALNKFKVICLTRIKVINTSKRIRIRNTKVQKQIFKNDLMFTVP